MQSKSELEAWYAHPDPWGYETNPDDIERKKRVLSTIPGNYKRALDIGCGEGWITKDLPAKEIYGLELSDTASDRFPENVKRVREPKGRYDLILATGVLYPQYNWRQMLDWILEHRSGAVLIAGIKDWFVDLSELGEPTRTEEFKYRDYIQQIRIYE